MTRMVTRDITNNSSRSFPMSVSRTRYLPIRFVFIRLPPLFSPRIAYRISSSFPSAFFLFSIKAFLCTGQGQTRFAVRCHSRAGGNPEKIQISKSKCQIKFKAQMSNPFRKDRRGRACSTRSFIYSFNSSLNLSTEIFASLIIALCVPVGSVFAE